MLSGAITVPETDVVEVSTGLVLIVGVAVAVAVEY